MERRMENAIPIATAVREVDEKDFHNIEILMRVVPPSVHDPRPGKMAKHILNIKVESTEKVKTVIVRDVVVEE